MCWGSVAFFLVCVVCISDSGIFPMILLILWLFWHNRHSRSFVLVSGPACNVKDPYTLNKTFFFCHKSFHLFHNRYNHCTAFLPKVKFQSKALVSHRSCWWEWMFYYRQTGMCRELSEAFESDSNIFPVADGWRQPEPSVTRDLQRGQMLCLYAKMTRSITKTV